MEWLLEKEDLWEVVSGTLPEPIDVTDEWRNKDRKARANIGLFLDESQFKFVKDAASAKGMWNALKEKHEKATMSTIVHYLSLLCGANMSESDNMEDHLSSMEDLFDKLAAAGHVLDVPLQIAMIFRSVPPSYRSLVQSLQTRADDDWTVASVKASLLDEYSQRVVRGDRLSRDLKAMKTDASGARKEKVCFFCKQPGHFKKNCKKWLSIKSESNKNRDKDESSKDKSAKNKPAHGAGSAVCFMAGGGLSGWIIDSGATCHMTSDRSFFAALISSAVPSVTLADGKKTSVGGVGHGVVFGVDGQGGSVEITLNDVLYVPELDGGLISVVQLVAKKFKVEFNEQLCEIKNQAGVTVVVGDKVGCLYRLRQQQGAMKACSSHENCQHLWHRRIGHRDPDVLRIMEKEKSVSGFKFHDCGMRITCECCLKGKLARQPVPAKLERSTSRPLEIIHTDICCPMETVTPSGNRYIMTLIDDYSRYAVVCLLRKKSEAASKIKEYVRLVENVFGRKPLVIRSDGGGEFQNRVLQEFYQSEGIKAQFTTPYSSQQNEVAERKSRSLQEMAICLLADANMTKLYWGEAVMTAAYLQNRLPSRVVKGTPFELWTGRKSDIKHLRVFGCEAYVHIPDVKRSKLDPKAVKLRFVGYSEDHKGYRFLDPTTNRITISRDAKFLEHSDGSEQQELEVPCGESEAEIEIPCKPTVTELEPEGEPGSDSSFEGWGSALGEELFRGFDAEDEEFASDEEDQEQERDLDDQAEAAAPGGVDNGEVRELRREDRRTRGVLPHRYGDFVVGVADCYQEEPTSYQDAMKIPKWKQAMNAEMAPHAANQTWELVQLPKGKKLIGSKWIFKLKRSEVGEVVTHKARLVAQGFNQRYGINYVDVFAPVTRLATLRMVLAVAGKRQMFLHHFDIKTAYLNGILEEEVYMRQPPGYLAAGKESLVCLVKKSLYGLKQSARCWNRALHEVLIRLKFRQCKSDPCLYLRNDGEQTVILLVYVDDLLVGCKDESEIRAIFTALRDAFEATNLGPVRQFLGLEVLRNEGFYSIRLTNYIETLLSKFEMSDCNVSKTPKLAICAQTKTMSSTWMLPDIAVW